MAEDADMARCAVCSGDEIDSGSETGVQDVLLDLLRTENLKRA